MTDGQLDGRSSGGVFHFSRSFVSFDLLVEAIDTVDGRFFFVCGALQQAQGIPSYFPSVALGTQPALYKIRKQAQGDD